MYLLLYGLNIRVKDIQVGEYPALSALNSEPPMPKPWALGASGHTRAVVCFCFFVLTPGHSVLLTEPGL